MKKYLNKRYLQRYKISNELHKKYLETWKEKSGFMYHNSEWQIGVVQDVIDFIEGITNELNLCSDEYVILQDLALAKKFRYGKFLNIFSN